MKYPKATLQELAWGGTSDTVEVIEREIVGTGRWSIQHRQVLRDRASGLFYETVYSVGATEQQAEDPYEYDNDEIELTEVFPVEKTITVYEATK